MKLIVDALKNYFEEWAQQKWSALLVILIFCFIGYKASTISFTWDEAASYLLYVQYNTWKPYETHLLDANNHIINTFFMILENVYLPKSVFYLRLHSVFSFLIYIVAAYSICRSLIKKGSILLLLCLIILHPYLLDFFSLARGYAMSLSFELLTLALLFSFIEKSKSYDPFLITISACFATLCNFSLLNFQLAILAVSSLYSFHLFFQKNCTLKKLCFSLLPGFILTGMFLYQLLPLLFKMKDNGNFYFGGSDGFWHDTVNSLIHCMAYGTDWFLHLEIILKIISISTFLIVPCWLIFKIKLKNDKSWIKLVAIYTVLILMIASTMIQHHYLNTLYLIERTALLFLPVFLILLVTLLYSINIIYTQYLLLIIFVFHCITSINLNGVHEWKSNTNNQKAIEIISTFPPPEGRKQINLSASFDYNMVCKFYMVYHQLKSIAPVNVQLNKFDLTGDYFMYALSEKNSINLPPIHVLYHDSIAKFEIAEKLHPYKNKIITNHLMFVNAALMPYDSLNINNDAGWAMEPKNIYSNSFKIILDSTSIKKNNFIEFDIILKINKPLSHEVNLIYNIYRGNTNVTYQSYELLNTLNNNLGQWVSISYAFPLPNTIKNNDVLSCYLLNDNKQNIEYKQFHLSTFYYQQPN